MTRSLGIGLPTFRSGFDPSMPLSLTGALAAAALLHLARGDRVQRIASALKGEDLDRWLALGAT